jgi:hypothetical protein
VLTLFTKSYSLKNSRGAQVEPPTRPPSKLSSEGRRASTAGTLSVPVTPGTEGKMLDLEQGHSAGVEITRVNLSVCLDRRRLPWRRVR